MIEKLKEYLTKAAGKITKAKRGTAKDSMRIVCL